MTLDELQMILRSELTILVNALAAPDEDSLDMARMAVGRMTTALDALSPVAPSPVAPVARSVRTGLPRLLTFKEVLALTDKWERLNGLR